jgi:hypothetical protein
LEILMLEIVQSLTVAIAGTSCLALAIVVRRSAAAVEARMSRLDEMLDRAGLRRRR